MIESGRFGKRRRAAVRAAALAACLGVLAACASPVNLTGPQPAEVAAAPPAEPEPPPAPPPPPPPPPVDLAGKWKLSLAGGGACFMTIGADPGAVAGTVAPAGGCPGDFFTSRKWTFEHDRLAIRDHKGEVLTELSFADGRFAGKAANGVAVTLAR